MAQSDPWASFDDAEPSGKPADPWAAFDDAPKRSRGQQRRERQRQAQAPTVPSDDIVVRPVDGDTAKLRSGNSLRLWGVDAPELHQQGWNALFQPVPIGEQSRNALAGLISPDSTIGAPVGTSYGRIVAPLASDGSDVGEDLVRYGNALAAPDFLGSDPQRRYDYLQSERLARQNRLGLHATYHRTPAEYRAEPSYVPSREEVAQFWDTPSPNAGLTADVERGYLDVVNRGSERDILSYAQAHGFRVDPAEVRDFIAARNTGAKVPQEVTYRDAPKPLTDPGDGRLGAVLREGGQGIVANQLEELGAIPDTFGLTSGRENVFNSDRRLADIYANNLGQNEAITGYDQAEYPNTSRLAEFGGALIGPAAKVRDVAGLAKWGAAYGGAAGLGQEGSIPERLTNAVVGTGEGLVATVLGTKALEAAAPYVARGVRRLIGKGGERVPGAPAGEFDPNLHPGAASNQQRDPDVIDIGQVPGGAAERREGLAPDSPQLAINTPQGFTPTAGRDSAVPMHGEPGTSVSQPVRQRDYLNISRDQPTRMDQSLTDAQRKAITDGLDPRDVLPIASNEVGSVAEAAAKAAGRYAEAKPIDESKALESRSIRTADGRVVQKRGPLDLLTWLRAEGGVRDQGGDLRAMGIDNAPRDMDFARGEQRFGKLIDDERGMTLDDAAFRAWEAGYLPGHERPDINTLLNAMDRTHSGSERYFHPDDLHEVAQFEGMRGDRKALEEQLAEGPVHIDRSVPAGPDVPFPPPQAYEDWPAGGPDFAGNINLAKLDTPQDIKRALDTTEKRVGFDAATRGRVTQAETERLASDLGMTPAQLLSRRKGQAFNAEEALAARQILAKSGNELVNMAKRVQAMEHPGDDMLAEFRRAWMRHAAIQEQVAGATAEAGRALAQFKMLANSRAVPGDVLSSIVGSAGGPDRIKQAAATLLEAVEIGPGKFNTDVDRLSRPRWRDKLTELYVNNLLTNPATHVVNVVSNTMTALAQLPEHGVAAAIGGARQLLPKANPDRVLASELGARAFGMMQGAKEGARYFVQALRTGEPVDWGSKVESQNLKAISGLKGEVVRLPTRLLTAEDELFKGIARRMELNGMAVRRARSEGLRGKAAAQRVAELVTNPPDDMLARSMDYARYVTFQQKLGPATSKLSGMTQDVPVLKLFLPFVRTPTNLLKFAVERSPAAPLLREWSADFRAGGARRDLALAKSAIGTGMGMVIYQAALDGKLSGSPPTDPAKARLMYADGWQPYSIRVGDKWISYKRLDPFSTTLGTAADLALLPEGMSKRQQDDKATLLIASIMGNLASKTWLSGISDIVGALSDPDQKADRLVQRLAGSVVVPAGLAQAARSVDPVQRQTGSVGEAVEARTPGLSSSLLPRRDVWGNEIKSEGGIGPDMLSPVYLSSAHDDPVNREMLKAGISIGMVPAKAGGRELTPEEHDRYQAEAGRRSYAAVRDLVTSSTWKMLDDDAKHDAVEKAVKGARGDARAVLFGGKAGSSADDPWRDFNDAPDHHSAATNDEWSSFKDPPQRDVLGNLLTIPGLSTESFTSGYRTPEYQADMRRRGYAPATNSSHLDGSSLDIVVPAGKSMRWLMAQVKRVEPTARFYPEGDHLHATFPDWYGAPVLGRAKAAGLHNPMAKQ